MSISEIIESLQNIKEKFGEQEVIVNCDFWGCGVDIFNITTENNYTILWLDMCGT